MTCGCETSEGAPCEGRLGRSLRARAQATAPSHPAGTGGGAGRPATDGERVGDGRSIGRGARARGCSASSRTARDYRYEARLPRTRREQGNSLAPDADASDGRGLRASPHRRTAVPDLEGQRFPEGALVTRHGVPVRVISPGRPGRGPGPDFRNAAIAGPSGVTLRGDIELHVRSSLFRAHGHPADRAYANVVLHVVFDDDTGEDTPLSGGSTAPVVALAPWVARRADELRHWLERPLLWREPCHDAVMRLGAQRL